MKHEENPILHILQTILCSYLQTYAQCDLPIAGVDTVGGGWLTRGGGCCVFCQGGSVEVRGCGVVVLAPTSMGADVGGWVAMLRRLGGLLCRLLPILNEGGGTLLTTGGGN